MGWNHHLEKYGPPKFQRLEPENDGLNSKFGISEIPGTEIFRWTMLKFIGISVYSCCFYGAPFGGSFFWTFTQQLCWYEKTLSLIYKGSICAK